MGLGSQEASIDIACSICFEIVADGGDRSTARLQCGHQFHLDCIGSAFNAKGVMQCPNCRKVEKGNWLFANGSCSLPEFSFDEWTHDEDLYDLSYAEMTLGVHWCPFSRLARVPPSFEDGEATPAFAFQDLTGFHSALHGNTTTSLAADPGSYLVYRQPLQTSASSDTRSSDSLIDHRSHASGALEVQTHGWEHHPPPYSLPSSHTNDSYQDAFSSTMVPSARVNSNGPTRVNSDGPSRARSFAHPFIRGHGSGSRPAGSFVSSPIPPHFTNPRHHNSHVRDVHDHRYRHHNGTILSGTHRPGTTNGLPQVGPVPPSLHDQTTYYLFPPTSSSSSSRSHQEVESTWDHFYSSESDRPPHFYPWRPFPHSHSSFRYNGSDRPSSQRRTESTSYRPPHVGDRMRHYI